MWKASPWNQYQYLHNTNEKAHLDAAAPVYPDGLGEGADGALLSDRDSQIDALLRGACRQDRPVGAHLVRRRRPGTRSGRSESIRVAVGPSEAAARHAHPVDDSRPG